MRLSFTTLVTREGASSSSRGASNLRCVGYLPRSDRRSPRNGIVATLIQSHRRWQRCITCARKVCLLLVARMSLLELSRETRAFRCSCFMESRVRGRARTGTPMTRFSLFVKAGECGRSTAKPSRAAREISLSLRRARSIVSRRLVTRRWYKSTFTSVLASSKRTCRGEAPSPCIRMPSRCWHQKAQVSMARLNEAKEPIPLAVHQVGSCCVSRRDAYRTDKLALPLVSQYLLDPNTPQGSTIGPKRRFVPDPTPGCELPLSRPAAGSQAHRSP